MRLEVGAAFTNVSVLGVPVGLHETRAAVAYREEQRCNCAVRHLLDAFHLPIVRTTVRHATALPAPL
jgi:hypothetical protein